MTFSCISISFLFFIPYSIMDNSTSLDIPPRVAAKNYGVTRATLAEWEKEGKIRFGTGIKRHFNVLRTPSTERAIIIYDQVSSTKLKEAGDLAHQIKQLKEYCPNYDKVIQDVASGLNFKRRDLTSLLDAVESGSVEKVVVTNRDRLARFGIDLLERMFRKHGTTFDVVSNQRTDFQGT